MRPCEQESEDQADLLTLACSQLRRVALLDSRSTDHFVKARVFISVRI